MPDTDVAVISGRSLADLQTLLGDPGGLHLIGSHGAERRLPPGEGTSSAPGHLLTPAEAVALADLRQRVDEIVARFPTVRAEPKPVGVAVHLRRADEADAREASAELARTVSVDPAVRTLHGKRVIELSVVAVDKGLALEALRNEIGATAAIFIGDDTTDEHAFAVLGQGDLGVKVGPGETIARTRIDSPSAVSDLLGVLRSARGARQADAAR